MGPIVIFDLYRQVQITFIYLVNSLDARFIWSNLSYRWLNILYETT